MRAAVLSIGTELTRGELINSNAGWLSERLTEFGAQVEMHLTVDDNLERIVQAFSALSAQHSVIVCTGGLGPTSDDITAEAVAHAMQVSLVRDEATLRFIEGLFRAAKREMSPSNAKQADFPDGASILANRQGTAPGFAVSHQQARAFFFPGVPYEMKAMFNEHVVPWLQSHIARRGAQFSLRTFGLPESKVGELLADIEPREPGLTIGYRAHFPEIEVKINVTDHDEGAAITRAKRITEEVRERLGEVVFGDKSATFAGAVGDALRAGGKTVALAESCTGGLAAKLLTDTPGSSAFFKGAVVTYADEAKIALLGVQATTLEKHGAVSEECVREMAEGARARFDSDLAVAISGIAGPDGGTDDKPVGTVCFALAIRGKATQTMDSRKRRLLFGDRERIRTMAAYVALKMLLQACRDEPSDA